MKIAVLLYKRKLYFIYRMGWRIKLGIDHQCRCTDVIGFAPCTDCGAGT